MLFPSWFDQFFLWFFPVFSCSGGELFHECVIEESFKERDVVRLLREILDGVLFLHRKNILHLDLKVSQPFSLPTVTKKALRIFYYFLLCLIFFFNGFFCTLSFWLAQLNTQTAPLQRGKTPPQWVSWIWH